MQLSLGDFVAARRSLKKAVKLGSQQPMDRQAVKKAFRYGKRSKLDLFFFTLLLHDTLMAQFVSLVEQLTRAVNLRKS